MEDTFGSVRFCLLRSFFIMKSIAILVLVLLHVPNAGFSQPIGDVSKTGTTAASFLEIGVGSRAVAMGEVFVAIASDASAVHWNPAGLAQIEQKQLGLHHVNWFTDVTVDHGTIVFPIQSFGTIAVSLTMLNMGDMDVTTVEEPEGTGQRFGANDLAAGISYARNLTDRFSIGGTIKFVRQAIWNMSANAVALDVGTLYTTPIKGLRLGMSISNFGTSMRLSGDDAVVFVDIAEDNFGSNDRLVSRLDMEPWSLPINFRAGLAYDIQYTRGSRLTLAVEGLHPNNNTESVNIGGEYVYQEVLFLRSGYRSLFIRDGEGGLSLGAGVKVKVGGLNLQIDYSYTDYNRLQQAQQFSLGLLF